MFICIGKLQRNIGTINEIRYINHLCDDNDRNSKFIDFIIDFDISYYDK